MMYHTPGTLPPQGVVRFREQLEQAEWVGGRATTGVQDMQIKNNQQVDTRSMLYAIPQNEVLNAVSQHTLFFAVALPRIFSTPLFNRYQNNKTYGFHVDGAVCSHPQNGWMRVDPFATLSLSDPQSHDDDELVVNDIFGQYRVELPVDDLVLYPPSSPHCVTLVTRGVRVVSLMWIQSMIRDDKRRTMLFELDNNIQLLRSRYGENEEILSLLNLYHNLLWEWSEI